MSTLFRWHPALRMAWREMLARPLRAVLLTVLVALPVGIAVVASVVSGTKDYHSANSIYPVLGDADARLTVTEWPAVRLSSFDQGRQVMASKARGLDSTQKRDPSAVDVEVLLPSGSRTTRVGSSYVDLALGGRVNAFVFDLDDPLTRGLARLESGRAPANADEVGISALMADELGLLDEGVLRDDAVLRLTDRELRVVGLVELPGHSGSAGAVVLPPAASAGAPTSVEYLVDLPDLSTPQAKSLQRTLASAGVSAQMRDAMLHPSAWPSRSHSSPPVINATAIAVGALVIGLGLIEVLVLVGSAFAVGARRQSRVLGLAMTSGGTPADVRRIVLAQGVWIGLAATALGAGLGAALLVLGRDLVGRLTGAVIYEYNVSVAAVVAVLVLGFASAVLAAAIPAWGAGRLTAAEALDGHIAAGTARSHGRRLRAPALGLIAGGIAGLLASGFWIADVYADQPAYATPVPIVAGGLSALVLLVGVGLLTPFLVDWCATTASRGWLPWRLASRDAGRHRGRTTAAVFGIGIVVAGAVLAGFGVSANAALEGTYRRGIPQGTASLEPSPDQLRDPAATARVIRAIRDVTGAEGLAMYREVLFEKKPVLVRRVGAAIVVDEAYLEVADISAAARRAFADGSALVARAWDKGDQVTLVAGPGRAPILERDVPAVRVRLGFSPPGTILISAQTATRLGLSTRPGYSAIVYGDEPLTPQAVERLGYYGINAYTEESDVALNQRVLLGGVGGVLVLTCLVVGMMVALASSESRGDAATLSSVGAPPWVRRAMSAAHALFVGCLGAALGLFLGTAGGVTLFQVIGTRGTPGPWLALLVFVIGVPFFSAVVGWLVTPTRLTLNRRTG
ncbi:hypothetical protein [Nocardioides sp. LHG3406-4]|uniref:hypothetical protein n=1 Tax=Nocardioides sp. LHG3406-4 TaxID=2804575 RepID=UPI003CFB5414